MVVYLITHAHTEQQPGVAADAWRLSSRGIEQAKRLASAPLWEKIDRVVVSAEPKTWLTVANLVLERGLPVWVDSRFDELRRSGWAENYGQQVAEAFAAPSRSNGGWEPVDSVRHRAMSALEDIERRFAGETVAVVGHGLCLSIVRAAVLGHTFVDFPVWQRLQFASVCCVALHPPSIVADFELSATKER